MSLRPRCLSRMIRKFFCCDMALVTEMICAEGGPNDASLTITYDDITGVVSRLNLTGGTRGFTMILTNAVGDERTVVVGTGTNRQFDTPGNFPFNMFVGYRIGCRWQ